MSKEKNFIGRKRFCKRAEISLITPTLYIDKEAENITAVHREKYKKHQKDYPRFSQRICNLVNNCKQFRIIFQNGWIDESTNLHLTCLGAYQLLAPEFIKNQMASAILKFSSNFDQLNELDFILEAFVFRLMKDYPFERPTAKKIEKYLVKHSNKEVPILVNGFRLAKIPFDETKKLQHRNQLVELVQACERSGIFLIIEGAFTDLTINLSDWLEKNKNVAADLSGGDAKGERHILLGDYAMRLKNVENSHARQNGVVGNFSFFEETKQINDLDILRRQRWLFSRFLPWAELGGMGNFLSASDNRTRYGPSTFGGDMTRSNLQQSRRSSQKTIFGGSTMHLDGMGTTVAIGGLKDGLKLVTAIEAADALLALKVAGFTTFAKPGGSRHLINQPISNGIRKTWMQLGIRFATFEIKRGDAYMIPAGIPHEFKNIEPSLSVAWNFIPDGKSCALGLAFLCYSLNELQMRMRKQPSRQQHALDFAPDHLLIDRVQKYFISNPL